MWLTALQKELGGEVSDEKMRDYIWNTLKSGRVSHPTYTARREPVRKAPGVPANAQSGILLVGRLCLVMDTPS